MRYKIQIKKFDDLLDKGLIINKDINSSYCKTNMNLSDCPDLIY